VALAWLDADDHALAIDVGDAKGRDLADTEAAGVQGHEQGAMLEVGGGQEQGGHLLRAQDLGQRAARPLIRDLLDRPVLLEDLAGEEAQGTDDLVEIRPRDPAIAGQVELVPADVLRGELIRGAHEVAHEMADTAQVALARVGAVATDAEIFVHPVVDSAHDVLLCRV